MTSLGKLSFGSKGFFVVAAAAAGAGLAYVWTMREVRRKCKKQVFTSCDEIPLLSTSFCREQAEEICT